jgi:plastocyanin
VAGAGTEQTIPVENVGNALHNLHIEAAPGAGFAVSFCTVDGDAPCTDPARMRGGQEGTITFTLAAGTYAYRCDFHTAEMVGEITVQ